MSADYRYQRSSQIDTSNLSPDTRAIIAAIEKGWIGRGFAIGFGMSVLGFVAATLWWLVIYIALQGTR